MSGHNRKMNANPSFIQYTETEYLPYSDKQIFNMIADVERYPDFLPGWLMVKIKSRNENSLTAHQKIGIPLFYWEFDSQAIFDEPRHVHVSAHDGPFHHLDIHWQLEPVTRQLTRVTITVEADFVPHARKLLDALVERSMHSLLEHFINRAHEIYDDSQV